MHNFLELQRLVDDLVDFLGLSIFINTSLPEIYYLMKWIEGKNILLDTIYVFFFLKTVMDDLNQWLVVTCLENKYCTEKDDYM